MYRIQDSRNAYDMYTRYQDMVLRYLEKVKVLEIEYQIERAKRIAQGKRKATSQESMRLREIKYNIQLARRTERVHNKWNLRPMSIFENAINNEKEFVVSKEILAKYYKHLDSMRTTNRVTPRERLAERTEAQTFVDKVETSPDVIRLQREIRKNVADYATKNNLSNILPEFDANAPEERDFSFITTESKKESKKQ